MSESWFFPDSYLAEMEALVSAIYEVEGKAKKPDIKDVLLMAQAFGVYFRGQTEKAGSIQNFLKGIRKEGGPRIARTEMPNKRYYEFLTYVSQQAKLVEEAEFAIDPTTKTGTPAEPVEEKEEPKAANLSAVWSKMQDLYQENAPKTWPQLIRRSKLAKMGTKLQEGIDYAGGVDQFLGAFASALNKVPEFYRNQYPRQGAGLRPPSDCILCLISGDKNHRELGVSGWRMFEWADSLDASEVMAPGIQHPSEEFLHWTGTRWSYKRPELDDEILDQHKADLIAAGLGPADS
jgi:hypothetical protein